MCTVGLLVSYLCILEVLVSTFAHLLYRKFTCAYLLHLWNDQSEQHQCSCSQKWFDYLGMYWFFKKIHVEISKNDDALLMHFWCTFEALLKLHHLDALLKLHQHWYTLWRWWWWLCCGGGSCGCSCCGRGKTLGRKKGGERKGKKEDRTGQPKQKSVQGSESKQSSIQYKQFNPRPSTKHAGRPADLTHGLQPSFKKNMDWTVQFPNNYGLDSPA